jgi:endoglucanase
MFASLSNRYRNLPLLGRLASILVPVIVAMVLVVSLASTGLPGQKAASSSTDALSGPLHAEGSKIVDVNGKEVALTGVNWFGFETGTFAPHGLWTRNMESMLDQMKESGYNTIRLPYSNELFKQTTAPEKGIDYGLNPDLQGLYGLELMDRVVKGATDRGLMVLLDRHRPDSQGQSELWYTSTVSEKQWIDDWTMLAGHYRNNPLVIGGDLHNEPRGQATWGDGNEKTDWRAAAERAGNAVLQANPNWLIVVEGVDKVGDDQYWWGGNLMGAKDNPVRLSQPDKLVYSAHDYGPGVYRQGWFDAPNFPENMPDLWTKHWAYLNKDGIAPVLLGEFGGRSMDPEDTEGVWQRKLFSFLKEHGMSYTYWSWNPNSGDTGGILKDDWQTIDQAKLDVMKEYQAPRLVPPDAR